MWMAYLRAETKWKNRQKEVFWKWEETAVDAQVGDRLERSSCFGINTEGKWGGAWLAVQAHSYFKDRLDWFLPIPDSPALTHWNQQRGRKEAARVEEFSETFQHLSLRGNSTCLRGMKNILERMVMLFLLEFFLLIHSSFLSVPISEMSRGLLFWL